MAPAPQPPPGVVGTGTVDSWPEDHVRHAESDFRVEPRAGLAVVAAGMGAIGGQGRPAGKLALWSVVGEALARPPGMSAETCLGRGFSRAREAVERLSWNWPAGLHRPAATMAALLLDGESVVIAHIGACRVSRVRAAGLEPLTVDHTVAQELQARGEAALLRDLPASFAHVLTRSLPDAPGHETRRVEVRAGDRLLIAGPHLHRRLGDAEIAACLSPEGRDASDLATATDRLRRRVRDRSPDGGEVAFAVVELRRAPSPAAGRSAPPPRCWLYHPGEALPDPPAAWRRETQGAGPDRRWFAEVWSLVVGTDA